MLKSVKELRIPQNATPALRTSISNAALIKQNIATLEDDCVVERTPAEVLRTRIENIIVTLPAMFNLQGHQSDLELEIAQAFKDWGLLSDVEAEAFMSGKNVPKSVPVTESQTFVKPFTFRTYADRLSICGIPSSISQILYNHIDDRGVVPISGSQSQCRNYLFDTGLRIIAMSIDERKIMLEAFRDSLVGIINSTLSAGDAGYALLNRFQLPALSETMLCLAKEVDYADVLRRSLNTAFGKDLAPAYKKLILDLMEIDQNVYNWTYDAKEIYDKYELHSSKSPSTEVLLHHVKQFRDTLIECLKFANVSADASYEEKSTQCLALSVLRLIKEDFASIRMFTTIHGEKFPADFNSSLARLAAVEEVVAEHNTARAIAENMSLKELYQIISDSIKKQSMEVSGVD